MGSALARSAPFDFGGPGSQPDLTVPPPACSMKAREAELYYVLLSSTARSDAGVAAEELDEASIPTLTDAEIEALVLGKVPGADAMLDRLGQYPICHYLCATYRHGLPAQAGSRKLQGYTRAALRYVLHAVSDAGPQRSQAGRVLRSLAEAFQACQQVQARTIDSLYGALSGRTQGLREQLLTLVDAVKQQALDRVTLQLHPGCLSPEADMGQQMPHIQSSYISACGELLGLRGMAAGRADRMKPRLSSAQVASFVAAFAGCFSVQEVVQALVRDVNQSAEGAERFVSLESLYAWCREASEDWGFDKAAIFHQEERPELYSLSGPPPRGSAAERLQAPWLHPELALEILCLCLGAQRRGSA